MACVANKQYYLWKCIMNCERVKSKLSALSADTLSSNEAGNMLAHFAECRSCQQEWTEYQQMLFVVSSVTQPLPNARQSQQMWAHCKQHLIEQEIHNKYTSPTRRQAMRNVLHERHNPLWGWLGAQPRWSWAAFGGALAALLAAWFVSSPTPQPANTPTVSTAQLFAPSELGSNLNAVEAPPAPPATNASLSLPSFDDSAPAVFEAPPMPTSPFVEHHAVIESDPLHDAAGSSVVSYTLTTPQQ